uniref:Uncharacterized protein n=1 Tax=Cyprinodon variegatus TaxID=28743 RepID=A0A3Q2FJR3_CYPVA
MKTLFFFSTEVIGVLKGFSAYWIELKQRITDCKGTQTRTLDKSTVTRPRHPILVTWSAGKGSPQSPSGKSRSREKGKRSGKTERGNPQQLYRLSITNPRTIGIAYPQQKVLPPKKLEPKSTLPPSKNKHAADKKLFAQEKCYDS